MLVFQKTVCSPQMKENHKHFIFNIELISTTIFTCVSNRIMQFYSIRDIWNSLIPCTSHWIDHSWLWTMSFVCFAILYYVSPKNKKKTKKLCTPIKCNEFWKLYTKRTICKSNGKLFNKNIAIFDVNEVLFWFALRITFEFMSCKINRYVHIDFSMQTENVVALVAHNFFSLNNSMIKPRVIVCASFLFYLLPFVL